MVKDVLPWVVEETAGVDLNDKRLDGRYQILLQDLASAPAHSIPAACNSQRAEYEAAYRFFANKKVGFDNLLETHIAATVRRAAEHPVVLTVQDTTEVDLTRPQTHVEGAGAIDGNKRIGALLHPLMAFTPEGTPLGTLYAEAWTRSEHAVGASTMTRAERRLSPIEEKESMRWVDALRESQSIAAENPGTRFINVADSESDIYEYLEQAAFPAEFDEPPPNHGWMVRAGQDRALITEDEEEERSLRERLQAQDVRLTHTIRVRGRKAKIENEKRGRHQPRESRNATVEVRTAEVTLRPPYRPDRKLSRITVNAILVTEVDPPQDDAPIEWLILTSEPVETVEDVLNALATYASRWLIEVFFRTLKSGCRIEARRFEHIDRVLSATALYLVVAWRTMYVCRLGREFPDIDCEAIFEPSEWKAVYQVVTRRRPPKTPPKLQDMVRMVAALGGYIERPGSEPGTQTTWIGLQRMHDMARCWDAFGPGTAEDP